MVNQRPAKGALPDDIINQVAAFLSENGGTSMLGSNVQTGTSRKSMNFKTSTGDEYRVNLKHLKAVRVNNRYQLQIQHDGVWKIFSGRQLWPVSELDFENSFYASGSYNKASALTDVGKKYYANISEVSSAYDWAAIKRRAKARRDAAVPLVENLETSTRQNQVDIQGLIQISRNTNQSIEKLGEELGKASRDNSENIKKLGDVVGGLNGVVNQNTEDIKDNSSRIGHIEQLLGVNESNPNAAAAAASGSRVAAASGSGAAEIRERLDAMTNAKKLGNGSEGQIRFGDTDVPQIRFGDTAVPQIRFGDTAVTLVSKGLPKTSGFKTTGEESDDEESIEGSDDEESIEGSDDEESGGYYHCKSAMEDLSSKVEGEDDHELQEMEQTRKYKCKDCGGPMRHDDGYCKNLKETGNGKYVYCNGCPEGIKMNPNGWDGCFPTSKTDWQCECTTPNDDKDVKCKSCGLPRP